MRPTVLVDVEPAVLQGALVVLLEELGIDEVIDLHEPPPVVDAAVVSAERSAPAGAKIVITLPHDDDLAERGTVRVDGEVGAAVVRITRIEDILVLLDVCCPGASPRTDRRRH